MRFARKSRSAPAPSCRSSVRTWKARCAAKARRPSQARFFAPAIARLRADPQHRDRVADGDAAAHLGAEIARRRLDADDLVVLDVLKRVDGVVADNPGDRARIEEERRRRQRAVDRGPAHQGAPGKAQPEHDLRQPDDALHERIEEHDQDRGEARGDREQVELQQHREADQALDRDEGERSEDAHLAGGQGPVPGPLDAAVEIAVDEVVIGRAGAAHGDGADEEEREMPEIRRRPGGERAKGRGPPARQEQKPPPDRPLDPREAQIGPQGPRRVRSTQCPRTASGSAGLRIGRSCLGSERGAAPFRDPEPRRTLSPLAG